MAPKVAICQPTIAPGGRLRVIVEIVGILNKMDITPDILVSHYLVSPKQIEKGYDQTLHADIRRVRWVPIRPRDTGIVLYNALVKAYTKRYDLVINTSNSLIFQPGRQKVLNYICFPRKSRIVAEDKSIHIPGSRHRTWSLRNLERQSMRLIYKFSRPQHEHLVVCISRFTKSAMVRDYGMQQSMVPVVYPPVDIERFTEKLTQDEQPRCDIVTVGRFSANKRQLEQIKIAANLPEYQFHLVGFADNYGYFEQCIDYAKSHNVSNVHFHPSASFQAMKSLLQHSKYFLHTKIKEHFGITIVQAIAAGCIPIVHNSGGQREIVPQSALHYEKLTQVPAIIQRLETATRRENLEVIEHLQQHVEANFSAAVFRQHMGNILENYLDKQAD
jgi:glycosyltransferase involved in cell wall biosynthesis